MIPNPPIQDSIPLLIPFQLHIDPMDRLLLINFEKDPDDYYIGFEPQIFDDQVNGNGHLVVAWRVDGKVDVYYEKGIVFSPSKYTIAGKGLSKAYQIAFEAKNYVVREDGVSAHYQFTDAYDRPVVIRIEETNPRKRKPFSLLAPMGFAAEKPDAIPLIFLYDFYFVRRKQTQFLVQIGSRKHNPDKLPMKMDGASMYFTRYSSRPLIATFNPATDGLIEPYFIDENATELRMENFNVELTMEEKSIISMEWLQGIEPVRCSFQPAFPNLASYKDESKRKGSFFIEAGKGSGSISGTYTVFQSDSSFHLSLHPDKGWKPEIDRFSLWFIYTLARPFKNWPKAYRWHAELSRTTNTRFYMRSHWERLK